MPVVEVVGAIQIGYLHIFVSTGYLIPHKMVQQCAALALQNHGKSFFLAISQSSGISSFGNIFAITE